MWFDCFRLVAFSGSVFIVFGLRVGFDLWGLINTSVDLLGAVGCFWMGRFGSRFMVFYMIWLLVFGLLRLACGWLRCVLGLY